jgi:aminomethyltransferase
MADLRRTPLNSLHRESGAKMVPFGDWDMPVEYAGLISEHLAVRQAAGLFDVSHMGEFEIEGEGALAFLQRVTANDVAKLSDGRAQSSALPNPQGCPKDDVILYRRAADRYLMIVNAANIEKDLAWLQSQDPSGCEVRDVSEQHALLALQGPRSEAILQALTPIDLTQVKFYRFAEGDVNGQDALVARTGYTGEDGFELLVAPDAAKAIWPALLEAGREKGLVPAGLGARDTLRLEARMLLYGNDMDETTSLFEAGLGWIVSLDEAKGDYNGRAALAEQKASGVPSTLVGFEVVGRGIARHGYPVFLGSETVGAVTSGSYAPFLRKNIGLCYLPSDRASVGTGFDVEIRGRRVSARVVPTPFYQRPR